MSFTVLLGTLVSLFALIAVGFICGKMKMVSDNAIADLTGLLMKFFLPCMLISSMARDFDVDHLNAEFQKIARRYKKAFLSDRCKEIEANIRTGKTRDFIKKIRDTEGTFHATMGTIRTEKV